MRGYDLAETIINLCAINNPRVGVGFGFFCVACHRQGGVEIRVTYPDIVRLIGVRAQGLLCVENGLVSDARVADVAGHGEDVIEPRDEVLSVSLDTLSVRHIAECRRVPLRSGVAPELLQEIEVGCVGGKDVRIIIFFRNPGPRHACGVIASFQPLLISHDDPIRIRVDRLVDSRVVYKEGKAMSQCKLSIPRNGTYASTINTYRADELGC